MARRTAKRRRVARWLPWTEDMTRIFRLASVGDWRPPASVRLSLGQSQMTLSGRFTAKDGAVMTARLRLRRDLATGLVEVVGEELSIPVGIVRKEPS